MRERGLKAGVTALTLAAAVASALYVSSHLRNQGAPLHPPVLTVSPGVTVSPAEPVTSTYVS